MLLSMALERLVCSLLHPYVAGNHQIITFLDDDPLLWNRTINGFPFNLR